MAGNPSWIGSFGPADFSTASVTRLGPFGQNGVTSTTNSELLLQAPSLAGVYSKLGIHVTANARVTDTTLRFRINGANGNMTITIPAGATGYFRDDVNTDTIVAGDLIAWGITTGTGTQTLTVADISVVFTHGTSGTVASLWRNSAVSNAGSSSGDRGWPLGHHNTVSSSLPVPAYNVYAPDAGVLERFFVYVNSNSAAGDTTHRTYINGANGNQLLTFAAAATGLQQDTSNTDTVAADDAFYSKTNSQNTSSRAGVWWRGSSTKFALSASYGSTTGQPPSDGSTRYFAPFGSILGVSATESAVQVKAPFMMIIRKMRVYYSINNSTTPITFILRVNGSDTGLSVTVPGTGTKTGLFSSSFDVLVAQDDLISVSAAGANSSLNLASISFVADSETTITASPGVGSLALTGFAPSTVQDALPGAGSLTLTGYAPTALETTSVTPGTGGLTIVGYTPTVTQALTPGAASLTLTGFAPEAAALAVMRASQLGLSVLAENNPELRASQLGLSVLAENNPELRASQLGLSVFAINLTTIRVTQMGLLVLALGGETPIRPDPLNLSDMGRQPVLRQRLVNMYVEATPQGPNSVGHFARPGLKNVRGLGGAKVHCTFQWQGFQFTVTNSAVWRDSVNIAAIVTGDYVSYATSQTQIVIVTNGKAYEITTTGVTLITDPDLPENLTDVINLGGRFIYTVADSGQWYYSSVGIASDIDGLNFATAENSPDNLVGVSVLSDMAIFWGTRTAEWWYPTAEQSAPFKRSAGRTYSKGLIGIRTKVQADNSIYFLGSDRMVYRTEAVPVKVSTEDIDDRIRRVSDEDIGSAYAFAISYGGHTFYVLTLPGEGSWAYDINGRRWAEWKSWNRDKFRVNCADNFVMGDSYTGTLMAFDGGLHEDLGEPLERICSTFAPIKSGVFVNFNIALGCLRGVGLADGDANGVDPVVEMRYSDDLGATWDGWFQEPLGRMGDRKQVAVWTQLGMIRAPGRLIEFRCTDPVPFAPYEVKFNEERP